MKFIYEHKGLIIFFMLVALFMLIMSNEVEKNNDRMNQIKMQERS